MGTPLELVRRLEAEKQARNIARLNLLRWQKKLSLAEDNIRILQRGIRRRDKEERHAR